MRKLRMLDRRCVLTGLGASLIVPSAALAAPSPDEIGRRLADAERAGRIGGLHALLISRGGTLLLEHYGKGDDESEIKGELHDVAFAADVPHDLRSVSKSVVGLAYGIALADGKVPPPEARLYEQFPEYADIARQSGRDRITIHHLLSMTLGLDWDELTIPYGSDLRNSEIAMEAAPDRFRFILERPIVAEPGTVWTYCGGATALLGHLISKGTGEALLPYCRRVLFDPLGFGAVDWAKGRRDGEYRAASGLRLLPRDLLKIGELVRAGGAWTDRQVVPRDWLKRSVTPAAVSSVGFRYGYHWYLGAALATALPRPEPWIGGIGWGGQRLYVFPALDLVVAQVCGNYDKPAAEQRRINDAILNDVVLPGFVQ
ncbi:serine hydrolase [Bradyrhizobium tropiciagri]|uniref:serine hydrolase domain-containing protein n=1 Tax=Bradyrhizobium tropiciagri TaxID=312253 RepID=UPI001BA57DA4|nr:serine hydrolase [Bradyrhizobium tropiciagri]MBR0874769.1 serine hydrolase [Bradyrhizobium tropiciagri]